ncbi:hypothetical protein AMTR_s00122p00065540 [Amborella trichopoda]|uniref:Uncharacterized protein n=1 Tax=Amborella trichopoda TaxID=13333 RepID=W1NN72_AMBTC|nr:hypothetical protein AMTR_s00122p00065540 [Amborella trichopoda]
MIYSDQETTCNPGVASRVQEMGPVTIEPVHELTPAPPSPSRMSLDPCPKEHAPSTLEQASEVASRAVDEVPTTVQGDMHESDKGPEQHEGAALGIVGNKDPSVVKREGSILSEQPVGIIEGVGEEGPSSSFLLRL